MTLIFYIVALSVVAAAEVQLQILNNFALDERVREELVCHLLTNNIHPLFGYVKPDDDEGVIINDDNLEEDDGEMEEDAIMSPMMTMGEE
ncbi:hypothetical protein EV1_036760 [Malus domestica]